METLSSCHFLLNQCGKRFTTEGVEIRRVCLQRDQGVTPWRNRPTTVESTVAVGHKVQNIISAFVEALLL
jgi:hypothetical protein